MRTAYEANPNMSKEEAEVLLERCIRVLYYRDGRSLNKFQTATITSEGISISEPHSVSTNWEICHLVR
jgi:20S proteasome subunit beta 7